jgi:predicted amidohydrolase
MKLRVSAVQYHLHTIQSFEEFAKQVEHYIKTAEEFGADFVLFLEFFTTKLMSIGNQQGHPLTIQDLPDFTEHRFRDVISGSRKRFCHYVA